jgi:F-type H+-transporting ATPase subunit gamma
LASLKDIKRHIVAVKQTQKLTKAMNMVAAAKLRSTQGRTERFRFYAQQHARLIGEIGKRSGGSSHSLLASSKSTQDKVLLLVFTSDRGLCGSFNSNIFYKLDAQIIKLREQGLEPDLFIIGRKGREYYRRRRINVAGSIEADSNTFTYERAQFVTADLIKSFENGTYKQVWMCHTRFQSLTKFVVTLSEILPLSSQQSASQPISQLNNLDYAIEPKADELLGRLIPRSLTIMVFQAFLESVTSENAARMQAMDNASKSCKDIIESLTMSYNKARQASVTNELLDIVNGAEALKG